MAFVGNGKGKKSRENEGHSEQASEPTFISTTHTIIPALQLFGEGMQVSLEGRKEALETPIHSASQEDPQTRPLQMSMGTGGRTREKINQQNAPTLFLYRWEEK